MRIALTGGPCGGKTTLMKELRTADPDACRWLMVPEAAPLLFEAGLRADNQSFQVAVVRLQCALEDSCAEVAGPDQILLCHRGTLDALAYWLKRGWDEQDFFRRSGLDREEHFKRYLGVVHLQTTACGAPAHYRRWPRAHRLERLDDAVEIDEACDRAWRHHPRFVRIDNLNRNWRAKSQAALAALTDWTVDSCRHERSGAEACCGGDLRD